MFQEVTNAQDIVGGKPILAWVGYPYGSNPYCFAYPEWVQKGDAFLAVSREAVPDRGCIYVNICGDDDAGDIRMKYGEVVVATINADTLEAIENTKYGTFENDRYYAKLNERLINSQISFTRLDFHALGRDLLQVVELENASVSLDAPLSKPVALNVDEPLTPYVMVERTEGSSLVYYGPFSLQPAAGGLFELNAVADARGMVHRIDSSEIGDVITVHRHHDSFGVAAKFVQRADLNRFFNRPTGRTAIDWITDAELVDALANVMKNTRSLSMRPEDVRSIRKAVSSCTMETTKIYVTDDRKRRMDALLSDAAAWSDKLDVVGMALVRPDVSAALFEGPNRQMMMDLFLESPEVREQVEAEKKKYELETQRARKAKEVADRELAEGRRALEELKRAALSDVQGELDAMNAELAAKQVELEKTDASLASLDGKVEDIVSRVNLAVDEAVCDLAHNRLIAQLASGAHAPSGRPSAAFVNPAICEGEADMSAHDVVAALHERIVTRGGRDLSEAEVINLLVCLAGANITVLSGLPGTGKTSLASILAGALGLTNAAASRFSKVSVERGWASHRDYIGYYNPLSKTLEASNAEVFEAMRALDEECRAAGTSNGVSEGSVPYLFLLDEANLSVVENYWSPFLGNSDEFLRVPTSLNMQGGSNLKIPSNVRWVATVNYDHTTEALSERFLNRAWVINVGGEALSIDDLLDSSDACDFSDVVPFSYGKLLEVFGPQESPTIEDQAAKRLLVNFFEACRQANRPVSYRCQRAIARYVSVAEPLLKEFGNAAGVQAVDFALSQRMLPSINGVGDGVRSLLEQLADVSPALTRTNACIGRMVDAGDSDGFYQFFA